MPPVSEKQRRFFGAELGRKRKGEATKTDMPEATMKEFATAPEKKLPQRAPTLADRAKMRAKQRKKK